MPYCGELLPIELVDTIPDADRPRAEGVNVSIEGDELGSSEREPRYIGRFADEVDRRLSEEGHLSRDPVLRA